LRKVNVEDLGHIAYKEAWDYQEKLFADIIDHKMANRALERENKPLMDPKESQLLFCEHNHVYTLGKSGDAANILLTESQRQEKNIEYYPINRGGDITYHGPGQMVVYPLLDLDQFFTDIHKYLRYLEEAIILTMAEYRIKGERFDGYTGVWIDADIPSKARKICAMGVKCSRWVTMHGLAFNVNTDLEYFNNIVPCGITDKGVTSMAKELGHSVDMEDIKSKFLAHFNTLFDVKK
jgi:lipoyl(octanoyl) transferase